MTKATIQPLSISAETIFDECRIYKQWEEVYLNKDGKHKEIELPELEDTPDLRGLIGSLLHTILAVLRSTAIFLRLYRIQEWAAWKRNAGMGRVEDRGNRL